MHQMDLPSLFCWTRFGTEAGEPISAILDRKEAERVANNGIFYWGIGNSVAPAITALLCHDATPEVLFSPIKSKPRAIDVSPGAVIRWRKAIALDGRMFTLPESVRVTSRSVRSHYALVCSAADRLKFGQLGNLHFDELRNLGSGQRLGASQVTAVVSRKVDVVNEDVGYVIALRAYLVAPYFVRLHAPEIATADLRAA